MDIRIEECAVLRPGDKLILRVHPGVQLEQLQLLAEQTRERLPDNEVVILGLDGQMVVSREGT